MCYLSLPIISGLVTWYWGFVVDFCYFHFGMVCQLPWGDSRWLKVWLYKYLKWKYWTSFKSKSERRILQLCQDASSILGNVNIRTYKIPVRSYQCSILYHSMIHQMVLGSHANLAWMQRPSPHTTKASGIQRHITSGHVEGIAAIHITSSIYAWEVWQGRCPKYFTSVSPILQRTKTTLPRVSQRFSVMADQCFGDSFQYLGRI